MALKATYFIWLHGELQVMNMIVSLAKLFILGRGPLFTGGSMDMFSVR